MPTISIPITAEQERFIKDYIKTGKAENKAQVVRRALRRLSDEEALNAVLESERELSEGKVLRGDIRELLKKYK